MNVTYLILGFVLAIVAFLAAMLGIGGGALNTPLQMFFGIDIHNAATTSLFLILFISLGATIIYRRANKVDWNAAIVLEIFTIAGGFSGGYISDYISSEILTIVLIVVIIFSGILMITRKVHEIRIRPHGLRWFEWKRIKNNHEYIINYFIAFPICYLAGVISGLVGVGGGILKMPLLVLIIGMPMDIAIATSAFMIGITAFGGILGHGIQGHLNWKLSLILVPFVFIGSQVGAHTMLKINKDKLKKIFGIVMILIAAVLLLRTII